MIITHGALWHRSGENLSKESRVALLGSFAASYAMEIASEENHSKIIDKFTLKKKYFSNIKAYVYGKDKDYFTNLFKNKFFCKKSSTLKNLRDFASIYLQISSLVLLAAKSSFFVGVSTP